MSRAITTLIDMLAREEAALRGQAFLAPLLPQGRARVRLRGLLYEFIVANARAGWWICRARDPRHAEVVAAAEPWQRGDYLQLLPALRLVLLEPLARQSWLALPYNPSDAAQRFALAGPVVARLVEGGQPFERIIGRVEGPTIWYDDIDRRADPAIAEDLRSALASVRAAPGVAGLGAGERAAYGLLLARITAARAADAANQTEHRLRHALEIGGARLIGYELAGEELRVVWERDGQRGVTLVDAGLAVTSAGICLSGDDQRFDLASIVGVIRDAPDYARYLDEV